MGTNMKQYNNRINEIQETINNTQNMSTVARALGIPLTSLIRTCNKYNIEYNTTKGFSDATREKIKITNRNRNLINLNKILSGELTHNGHNSSNLRKRLIDNDILPNKCAICGINASWNGMNLTLHLDHISGNDKDNTLSNLRLLCPNCHSQTPTYAGKNIKNRTSNRFENLESLLEQHKPKTINELLTIIGIKPSKYYYNKIRKIISEKNIKTRIKLTCTVCGKHLSDGAKHGLCNKCIHIGQRKIERPTKEYMINLLKNKSILSISKQYFVSDNAIRKWMKNYEIPTKKVELQEYLRTIGDVSP